MNISHKKNKEDKIIADNPGPISSLEMKRIQEAVERSDTEKFSSFYTYDANSLYAPECCYH
jgi:hypothetical protein